MKIGVLGLGRFGRLHALTLARLAEADLVALVARRQASLDALARYEQKQQDKDLDTALTQSNHAAHVYCDLVQREAHGAKRLPVLNQCGRCYLLALLTELRCLVLADNLVEAERRSANEKATLTDLAKVTFEEVLGRSPEVYLDPSRMKKDQEEFLRLRAEISALEAEWLSRSR